MDKLISMTLTIFLLSIFTNKGVNKVGILLLVLLSIRLIIENKYIMILYGILIYLMINNYHIIQEYFTFGIANLNPISTKEYAIRVLEFITILGAFSNRTILNNVSIYFKKYSNIILLEVIISQCIIIYLLISRKGFINRWGMNNFIGTYDTPHPYGYMLIVMALSIEWLYIQKRNNKIFLLYIVPAITSLLTGARTPLVALVGIFIIFRVLKSNITVKHSIKLTTLMKIMLVNIVLILFGGVFIEFILNSNIVTKFIETTQSGTFDNGRTIYWSNILIDYFNNFNLKEKLLGHGIYYTVLINKKAVGLEIWAHSDFVDILASYGLIVLVIYMIFYGVYFYKLKITGINVYILSIISCIFIFLSVANGIINYGCFIPVFCYLSITLKSIMNTKDNIHKIN